MSKNIRGLTTSHDAETAIGKYRIAKFGTGDALVSLATAATDLSIGVTTDIDAAIGDRVDLVRDGITPVFFGGNVTRGAPVTADANGAAVAVTLPAGGAQVRCIGFAEVSGVSGDIGSVRLQPHVIYGGPA